MISQLLKSKFANEFGALDHKDGSISLEEYKRCSTSFNAQQAKYEQMFAKYDADKDGSISKDELLQLVHDFYQS